jgi:hypothetical protein
MRPLAGAGWTAAGQHWAGTTGELPAQAVIWIVTKLIPTIK